MQLDQGLDGDESAGWNGYATEVSNPILIAPPTPIFRPVSIQPVSNSG